MMTVIALLLFVAYLAHRARRRPSPTPRLIIEIEINDGRGRMPSKSLPPSLTKLVQPAKKRERL